MDALTDLAVATGAVSAVRSAGTFKNRDRPLPPGPMAIGNTEIMLIIGALVLLFGASAIPKLARSIGRAKGEFQQARSEFDKEVKGGEAEAQDEEKLRQAARALGIDDAGKSPEELKAAIAAKTQ
ncbi:MAG: twin-arginine translocase TatA/TatE family subunit [Thermoplasmatota archaeon]